ncbi:MAG: hypothetical protein SO157_04870 [Bullifex sp.]|nr:hypothetical protein [Bullifex sp.]
MDIVISSPGSPGTSLTEDVKNKMLKMHDVLMKKDSFSTTKEFKDYLIMEYGFNASYTRNVFPFLQFCGFIKYGESECFDNHSFFTKTGKTFVDIIRSRREIEDRDEFPDKEYLLTKLRHMENVIYFQGLVTMMKDRTCNYASIFYDVLQFVKVFETITTLEYMLLLHLRDNKPDSYFQELNNIVPQYRNGDIDLSVKVKTRKTIKKKSPENEEIKKVATDPKENSFPYVSGNFLKAGIFIKPDIHTFAINKDRLAEIESAMREVRKVWQSSTV